MDDEFDILQQGLTEMAASPAEHRTAALLRICEESPALRDEVERMLRELADTDMFAHAVGAGRRPEPTPPHPSGPGPWPERLGDFHLVRRLGGGGMGVVYLARQVSMGRTVALKLIRPEHQWFAGARERFRREADAVARLEHPAIAPLFATGDADGVPFLAMEWIEGRSLAAAVADLARQPPPARTGRDLAAAAGAEVDAELFAGGWEDACLRIAAEMADALAHAHAHGVVHRDVKPSNVMLAADGRAILIDFGLAHAEGQSRVTRTGQNPGSLPYMAPESLRGDGPPDGRTDVYALGVSLFELLGGRLPFAGTTGEEVQRAILRGERPRLRTLNSQVRPEVETIVDTAMAPEVGHRYRDARSLRDDLRRALARRPIAARSAGPVLRVRRFAQRSPVAATVLVVLGVSSLAMAWLFADAVRARRAAVRDLHIAAATRGVLADLLAGPDAEVSGTLGGTELRVVDVLDAATAAIGTRFADLPEVEAATRRTLGTTYTHIGFPDKGRPELERAHELLLGMYGADHAETIAATLALAKACLGTGDTARAGEFARAGLEGTQRTHGPDARQTLGAMHALADVLWAAADRGFQPIAREALERCQRLRLDEDDDLLLTARTHAALAESTNGAREAAEKELRDVLERRERISGPRSAVAMDVRGSLAWVLYCAEQPDEALPLLRRVLADRVAVMGRGHVRTLDARNDLAEVLVNMDRLDEAEFEFEELLRDQTERFGVGAQTAWTHNGLARCLERHGKLEPAEQHAREALSLRRRLLPADDYHLLISCNQLGTILLKKGRAEEALPLFREATEGSVRTLGAARISTSMFRINLGRCETELQDFAAAEAHLIESLTALQAAVGEDADATKRAHAALATLYERWNKPDQADKHR